MTKTDDTTTSAWWPYVEHLLHTSGASRIEVAEAIGSNNSIFNAWKGGGRPDVSKVRALALFFDRPVSEAFIRAGFATAEELKYSAPAVEPESLTDDQLLGEIRRRLQHAGEIVERAQAFKDLAPQTKRTVLGRAGR